MTPFLVNADGAAHRHTTAEPGALCRGLPVEAGVKAWSYPPRWRLAKRSRNLVRLPDTDLWFAALANCVAD